MKFKTTVLLALLLVVTSCSLSTDPDPFDPSISSVPYDNEEYPSTLDSVNLYWKCRHYPQKITLFDGNGNVIEQILPPSSRMDTLSDSSWTVGFANMKARTNYKWQVVVTDTKGTVITGPLWDFQFLPGGNSEGRLLKFIDQNVYLPHNIEVVFQVVDLYDVGDTNKTRNDFKITDDDTLPLDEEYVWTIQKTNPDYYTKIVLLLDASYSIKASPEFEKMKKEAEFFVVKYLNNDPTKRIELWKFSDTMTKLSDATSDENVLIPLIRNIKDSVMTTDLYGSVIKAVDQTEIKTTKDLVARSLIIVFTDGSDTQGRKTLNEARSAIIDKNVMMVNTDSTNTYHYYLNELTSYKNYLNNDHLEVLEFANDFSDLTLLTARSIYGLYYFSPKRGNNIHDLSIILKNLAYLGYGSVIKTNYSSEGFY